MNSKIKTGWKLLDEALDKNDENVMKLQMRAKSDTAILSIIVNGKKLPEIVVNRKKSFNVLTFYFTKEKRKLQFPFKIDSLEIKIPGVITAKLSPKNSFA